MDGYNRQKSFYKVETRAAKLATSIATMGGPPNLVEELYEMVRKFEYENEKLRAELERMSDLYNESTESRWRLMWERDAWKKLCGRWVECHQECMCAETWDDWDSIAWPPEKPEDV